MHRPYYDSYSYKYAESQIENDRLRRQVRDLNSTVSNLRWYNNDLKNEKSKQQLAQSKENRIVNNKIANLEFNLTDLKSELYTKEKSYQEQIRSLKKQIDAKNSKLSTLEWLNTELKKEKLAEKKNSSSLEVTNMNLRKKNLDKDNQIEKLKTLNSSLELEKSLLKNDNQKNISKLEKNQALFKNMYEERLKSLEQTHNSVIDAEKSMQLSKLDPTSYEYVHTEDIYNSKKLSFYNDTIQEARAKLNRSLDSALNSSTSFTDYYENKFGKTQSPHKARLIQEIDRDMKLYRMEKNLNESLERLKKWERETL